MKSRRKAEISSSALLPKWLGAFATIGMLASAPALAAEIHGQVLGAGAPIVGSTVTLWARAQARRRNSRKRKAARMAGSR